MLLIFSCTKLVSCLLKVCVSQVSYRDLRLCVDVTYTSRHELDKVDIQVATNVDQNYGQRLQTSRAGQQ